MGALMKVPCLCSVDVNYARGLALNYHGIDCLAIVFDAVISVLSGSMGSDFVRETVLGRAQVVNFAGIKHRELEISVTSTRAGRCVDFVTTCKLTKLFHITYTRNECMPQYEDIVYLS